MLDEAASILVQPLGREYLDRDRSVIGIQQAITNVYDSKGAISKDGTKLESVGNIHAFHLKHPIGETVNPLDFGWFQLRRARNRANVAVGHVGEIWYIRLGGGSKG